MCNIITYRVEKDVLEHPFLVEENSIEYWVDVIDTPNKCVDLANEMFRMKYLAEEMVCLMAMDAKGSVVGMFKVSQGTINGTVCNPREIFLRALVVGACSIIVIHNHPSGDTTPSDQDIVVFDRLLNSSKMMGITLHDFIIIGANYFSFREDGEWFK